MSVTVKGDSPFDAFIVSGIKDCQTEHIKFYNISFNCKTIEDADGRTFTRSEERKKGKWIEDKGQQTLMQNFIEMGEVWRVCSVCGAGHMIGHKYAIDKAYHDRHHNFCPNCGADMRGEQDG